MVKIKNKIILIIVFLCFLLGWDLGLTISNNWYKEENKKQDNYIKQLEMYVDSEDLIQIKRRLEL